MQCFVHYVDSPEGGTRLNWLRSHHLNSAIRGSTSLRDRKCFPPVSPGISEQSQSINEVIELVLHE
jgi:hypothetical protein